jgi:hypothetical protein
MSLSRRQFIKSVGVTLASLIVARTASACAPESPSGEPQQQKHPSWDQLRQCWLALSTWDISSALNWSWDETRARLDEQKTAHQAALDALVEAGEMDTAVAEQIQLAFVEAVFHIERSMATCYVAIPFEYHVLLQQVADDLDPGVLERAQAAIARDMAYLEAVKAGAAGHELAEQFKTDELEASPEAVEAAHILVDLLLGETE